MAPDTSSDDSADPREKRVNEWLRRLVDLSRRNRLLYHKPTRRQSIEILEPGPQAVVDHLLAGREWRFWLPLTEQENADGVDRPRSADELGTAATERKEFERTLENLYRRAAADFAERGVQILHLAVGFLHWHDPDRDEDVVSPLVLIPVELVRTRIGLPFTLRRSEEEAVVNPTLKVKLERAFGVNLPEIAGSLEADDDDDYELSDYLDSVASLRPDWEVTPGAVLSLYTFFKEVIYQDLKDNWESAVDTPLVGALVGGTPLVQRDANPLSDDARIDDVRRPKDSFAVLDADSSQVRCLEASKRGESIVVQGPPGTGKSQTITNLIGEAIARGESVLFVSEKMAALDVVHKNLTKVGLGEFCLELHSHKVKKGDVARALGESLQLRVKNQRGLTAADLSHLEVVRDELNQYAASLHEPRGKLGISAFSGLGAVAARADAIRLAGPDVDSATTGDRELSQIRGMFERVASLWDHARSPELNAWYGYAGRRYGQGVRQQLLDGLERASEALADLGTASTEFAHSLPVEPPSTFDGAVAQLRCAELLAEARRCPPDWLRGSGLVDAANLAREWAARSADVAAARDMLRTTYDAPPTPEEVAGFHAALAAARDEFVDPDAALLSAGRESLTTLREANTSLGEARTALATIGAALGFDAGALPPEAIPDVAAACDVLGRSERPPATWLSPARFTEAGAYLESHRAVYIQERNVSQTLLGRYSDAIFPLGNIADRYKIDASKLLPGLSGTHRADKSAVKSASLSGQIPETVIRDLGDAKRVNELRTEIDRAKPGAHAVLGDLARGTETDVALVESMLEARQVIVAGLMNRADIGALERLLTNGADLQFQLAAEALARHAHQWRPASDLLSETARGASVDDLSRGVARAMVATEQVMAATSELVRTRTREARSFAELEQDATSVAMLAEQLRAFDDGRGRIEAAFPGFDVSASGQWDEICSAVAWAQAVYDGWPDPIPAAMAERVTSGRFEVENVGRLSALPDASESAIHAVADLFQCTSQARVAEVLHGEWKESRALVERLAATVDDVRSWTDLASARDELDETSWGEFVGRLESRDVPGDQLVPAFERAFYVAWLEDVFAADRVLARFRGSDHEALISDFRDLDERLTVHAREVIIRRCNDRRPSPTALPGSEVSLVRKQAAMRRGHLPVRRLLERIPNTLPDLKPCLLMSPLSVSQYLSPSARFDLVIFDEASQVTTEDAICALYRGRRHVIAGDSKQLPPTGFFRVVDDETDESEDDEWDSEANYESILDRAASSGLRSFDLLWHYRSRDEALIAYSNKWFYRNRLVTFPSSWESHPSMGIEFRFVADGEYDRGGSRTNRREAELVSQLVFEHFRTYPDKSLGVVTFNEPQRVAVQDAVDMYRRDHPEFEDEFSEDRLSGFFVKNLENVQGDERDFMIFSVTYGPDASGRLTANFGPLTQRGGERRLNVAVTRAREKITVVSSMRSTDIDIRDDSMAGGVHLKRYLEYAERGKAALIAGDAASMGDFESEFEVAVAAAIRQLGYDVVPQVGVSGFRIDLGVLHPETPGKYLLGVECDGAPYHSAPSARDRDRLRQQILERLGWRIARVWSPDWNANRDATIHNLEVAITEALRAADDPESASTPPEESAPRETFAVVEDAPVPTPEPVARPDTTKLPGQTEIRAVVIATVGRAAGIDRENLIRQVARAMGYRRLGSRIEGAVDLAVAHVVASGMIAEENGGFILPKLKSPPVGDEVPDWDAVLEGQPEEPDAADVALAGEERVAPPDGNGQLTLLSDDPLLELNVLLHSVEVGVESAQAPVSPGTELVTARFTVANAGRVVFEPYRCAARWYALDDKGAQYEPSATRIEPSLHHARVRPNGAATGFITFEMPAKRSLVEIGFTPSRNSDTGRWPEPDVTRANPYSDSMPIVEASPMPTSEALLEDAGTDGWRVDIMTASITGATVSLSIDLAHLVEAADALDEANLGFKAGNRYVSKRGERQTIYMKSEYSARAVAVLESAGFDVRGAR